MSLTRGMRMLNAIEYGSLTSVNLSQLLANSLNARAEFVAALQIRGNFRRLMASGTATTTLSNSAAAMLLITDSKILREHFFTLLDNAAGAANLANTVLGSYAEKLAATPESIATVLGSAQARRALWAGGDSYLTPFAGTLGVNAMRDSPLSRIIPVTLTSANVAVRANTPSEGIMFGWSINSSTGILSTTSRKSGSSLGAITAAGGTVQGTKAEFDNVVPLQYSTSGTLHPTFTSSIASRVAYIGFLPTPAV